MNQASDQTLLSRNMKRKAWGDKISRWLFLIFALLSSSIIVVIVIFIFYKGITPFLTTYTIEGNNYHVSLFNFIFGLTWFEPPISYGVGFAVIDTLYIVLLALIIAVPISVLTALFIARIAHPKLGSIVNYVVELLASIPSVIFGLFGMGFIAPIVRDFAMAFGQQTAGGLSILTTVIVLSMMIMPTITMFAITAIKSVNPTLIAGSLALGASLTQTNFKVVLKAARSGIFAGIVLGTGRALGEATAVSMVIGNAGSGPTFGLFDRSRTLTSTMLLGFNETVGVDYDIRFSVGIILIALILFSNLLLNYLKKKLGGNIL